LKPQAMIANAVRGKSVTVWGSMQCPYYVQKALAPLFDLSHENVRVVQTETGGGFGGKEEYPNMIAGHAALLSWKAGGRPVEDNLRPARGHVGRQRNGIPRRSASRRRSSAIGTLVALDIDILLDGGAYPTLSAVVLSRATLHAWGPYKCGHTRVRSRVVMTNSVPYGAFRGFGAPQAIFAIGDAHEPRGSRTRHRSRGDEEEETSSTRAT